jgi:hypothetical protein
MKKVVLPLIAVFAAVSAFAQGTVNFNNFVEGVVNAPVYHDFVGSSSKVSGSGYTAQLFAGTQGTAESSLGANTPLSSFRSGGAAGYWIGTNVTVSGVAGGQTATLQVRVWDNLGGVITTWDQAVANNVKRGVSSLFDVTLGGGGNPPSLPADMVGLQSFAIVPEPSTIALGLMGAGAFLMRRKRRQ